MKWTVCCSLAIVLLAGCGRQPADPVDSPADDVLTPAVPPPPPPAAEKPPEATRRAATVGVGKKGRGYGAGPVATPIAAYFSTQQRIVFDIQIASAMNAYRAINGHFPKSHEAFMEEIVKKNSIKLPELPSGERYVYDPDKAATMSTYDAKDPPLFVERTP